MVNLSSIAVFPAIFGVRLAHQSFIRDHSSTLGALRNLGVSDGFFRRHLLVQALILAGLASVSAVVLGRLIVRPLLSLVFWGSLRTFRTPGALPYRSFGLHLSSSAPCT
ncbi:FtsX-like permease family protein [Corynebacterium yudongzhengii]